LFHDTFGEHETTAECHAPYDERCSRSYQESARCRNHMLLQVEARTRRLELLFRVGKKKQSSIAKERAACSDAKFSDMSKSGFLDSAIH
jgi:hypothetical protein